MIKRVTSLLMCVMLVMSLCITAFAANETNTDSITFEAKLDKSTLQASNEDQTVKLTIAANQEIELANAQLRVTLPNGWSFPYTQDQAPYPSTPNNADPTFNVAMGILTWSNSANVKATNLFTFDIKVPAGTAAGEYEISVGGPPNSSGMTIGKVGNAQWETGATASTTLTITEAQENPDPVIPTNETYTANLGLPTGASTAVKVGDTVTVDILVGGTTKEFASSELNLTYTGLTYVSGSSTVNGADVTAANGTIKIIDHGESTTWTDGNTVTAYSLVFTVDAITSDSGTASVTLSNAALSTKDNASGSNLTSATVTVDTKEFTVTPADLTVSLPTGLTGEGTATDNKYSVVYNDSFEFEATNKNYSYTLSVKDADGNDVNYTELSDGKWKISNVTSNVTVTITKQEAKIYTITFTDPTHIQNQESATVSFVYGTDGGFSFTLKDNVPPSTTPGTTYAVTSIKYADGTDVAHTAPETSVTTNRAYTIGTEAITGNITITTSATTVEPNQFTVTLPTSTYPELTADKNVVDLNGSIALTLDPVAGYKYTVKYKIGESDEVTITDTDWTETEATDDDKLTYTISNITANVTVSVTKEVDTSKFTVNVMTDYVAMDGKRVHLVRVSATLDGGYVLTYDGDNMYWSNGYVTEGYEYVYLVITDANSTLSTEAATAQIDIAKGAPVATITYTGDVNMTDKIDANDAQLVWNMYKADVYSEFADRDTDGTGATMEKYLRADVDKSGKVDVDDASAIVTLVKNRTSN